MFSPVFQKEMVSLARHRGPYWLRAVILCFLLGVMALFWHRGTLLQASGGLLDSGGDTGRLLFVIFVKTQLGIIYFVVPCIVASVVAAERERGTLDLLLLSELCPGAILADKLLSRFVLLFVLLLSALPVFIALLSFGGIGTDDLVRAYSGILAAAFYCGALSLFFSTLMQTMRAALVATYLSMFSFVVLFGLLGGYLTGDWKDAVTSMDNLLFVDRADPGPWAYFCGFSALCFGASLVRCVERLTERSANFEPHVLKRHFRKLDRFFHRINFTAVVLLHEHAPLGKNPVRWRESHKRFFATNIFLIRSFYVLCTLLLLFFAFRWPMQRYAASHLSAMHVVLVATLAMVYAAAAFTHEKENHTFDLILATPLSARRIVWGKMAGVLKALLVVALVPLIMPLVADMTETLESYRSRATLFFLTWMLAYVPLFVVIGFYFSLQAKTGLMAFLQTGVACSVAYFGPALACTSTGRHYVGHEYEPIVGLSPIFWLRNPYPLVTAVAMFALALLLLTALVLYFDRLVGR